LNPILHGYLIYQVWALAVGFVILAIRELGKWANEYLEEIDRSNVTTEAKEFKSKGDSIAECKIPKKEIYPKWVLDRTVFNSLFPCFTEEEYKNLECLYKHESAK